MIQYQDGEDSPRVLEDRLAQTATVQRPRPVFLNRHSKQPSSSTVCSSLDSRLQGTTAPGSPRSTSNLSSSFPDTDSPTSDTEPTSNASFETLRAAQDDEKETNKAPSDSDPSMHEEHKIATKEQLEALTHDHPLPQLSTGTWASRFRQFRHGTMSMYRRLWTFAILVNVAIIASMIARSVRHPGSFAYGSAATATGANLLVAALMRHEHCVNLIFRLATLLPYSTPLAIRRQAAKGAYSYGGLHSGCGISAMLWYIFYTVLAIAQFQGSPGEQIALATTAAATLLAFVIIIGLAHPTFRTKFHDIWEISHRFAGWFAIAMVWAQTLIIAIAAAHHAHISIGLTLVKTPTFWFLAIITCFLIYPWLRMRHRNVTPEVLSSHAVRLHFDDAKLQTCRGYRLSTNPLMENHGFATIPDATPSELEAGIANPPRPKSYSVLVSKAGDWTSAMIANPPSKIWTRGAPTTGVLRIASLFKPIVVVATGSGIGPCLSFLQVLPHYPMRVIWSARHPHKTYGPDIMKAVVRADREALVLDTQVTSKPDLSGLSFALAKSIGAEAVVIISNPWTTRKVVFDLESRGVPAFGAIFDS